MGRYKKIFTEDLDGNIEQVGTLKSTEGIKIVKNLSDKQLEVIKEKKELKEYSKQLGGFIHLMYIKNELLFNGLGLDRSNISRLIYLATYIDYNDREENVLIDYESNNKIKYLSRKDIKKIMGLSDSTFNRFMTDLKEHELLYEANGKFYITNKYFSKGKSSFDKKNYTRVYISTTRKLYKSCSSRMHKKLSYVYQLTPFINYQTNVLCSNPDEHDTDKLNKLGLKDICEILELSDNPKAIFKFEQDLYKITFIVNDKKHYMFSRVIVKGGNGHNDYFVVNPMILYCGSNLGKIKETISWLYFKEKK